MARCRGIKPGFMTNEALPELGPHAHLLFACLWMIADREGRLEDRPKRIKVECMPHYEVDVNELLDKLASGPDPFILRYSVAEKRYIQVVKWSDHQSPHNTEKPSVIPEPPLNHRELTVSSLPSAVMHTNSKQLTVNSKGGCKGGGKFTPPTHEEVAAYCRERGRGVNPEAWYAHYESNGWRVGRNKMTNWKAAVRTWEHSEYGTKGDGKPAAGKQFLEVTAEEFKRLKDLDAFKVRPYREKLPDGRVRWTGQKRDGSRVECFIEPQGEHT